MREPIVVLRAYSGQKIVFEVRRDRNEPWKIVGWDPKANNETDGPDQSGPDAINRIVFYKQPPTADDALSDENEPICEIPFISGSVDLRLTAARRGSRSVILKQGFIRCFLFGTGNEDWPNEAIGLSLALHTSEGVRGGYVPVRMVGVRLRLLDLWAPIRSRFIELTRESLLKQFSLGWFFDSSLTPALLHVFGFRSEGSRRHDRFTYELKVQLYPAKDGQPLQIYFGLDFALRERDYRFQYALTDPAVQCGVAEPRLRLERLTFLQFPAATVADWYRGKENAPDWCIQVSLPGATTQLLETYNDLVARGVHHSLHVVREGHPLSLLPELRWQDGDPWLSPDRWQATFRVRGEWETIKLSSSGLPRRLSWPADFERDGAFRLKRGTIAPAQATEGETEQWLQVKGVLPCFCTEVARSEVDDRGAKPKAAPLELLLTVGQAKSEPPGDALEIEMSVRQADDAAAGTRRVRLGALLLEVGGAAPANELPGRLRFGFRADPVAGVAPVVSEFRLNIGLSDVRPAGQDPLPGQEYAELFEGRASRTADEIVERAFRREPPLVLELPSARARSAMPRYLLEVAETILSAHTQTVDLVLRQLAAPAGADARTVLVIDRAPFLVAAVRYRDYFEDLVAGTTNEIGHFSTRRGGPLWEIAAGGKGFDLVLPPQGVGEAMEKYATRPGYPRDVLEGQLVAYRFTPPAVFRVQPAYYRKRYAEPPWNLRRLLGDPAQRDPGMGLEQAQFEMFYGLAGKIDAKGLRLAEVAARLGALAGRQPGFSTWRMNGLQQREYDAHRVSWARWYQVLQTRLAVLEPWRPGADNDQAPDKLDPSAIRGLALRDGVNFWLRDSARLAFPIPVTPTGELTAADVAEVRRRAPAVPERTYAPAPDFGGAPLAGGVGWPFESINLYDLLWRRPKADLSELHRPYFSALGGWGFQKASFADGQLRIHADTAMGRTHNVTLEILGRISVGWHLAKLVIVYERSVLPTRQFYHTDDAADSAENEQDALRGRPLLRKVREYVEILEPERRFPDNGAPAVERGCLLAIEFPEGARRINVTSRWGQDVGTAQAPTDEAEGWKVPLWVRGARPADVYPQPQIVAVFRAAQGQAPVRVEIDEPEKLFFFTSTKAGRSPDPHLWPPVQGIDFGWCHESAFKASATPAGWRSGDLETDNGEADPALKGGAGDFTFSLKRPGTAIDVMAERSNAPLGAVLRNVTVMRGYAPSPPVPLDLIQFRDKVQVGMTAARQLVGASGRVVDLRLDGGGALAALKKQLVSAMGPVRERIAAADFPLPAPQQLCKRLGAQARRTLAPLRGAARDLGPEFARLAELRAKGAASLEDARKQVLAAAADLENRVKTPLRQMSEAIYEGLGGEQTALSDAWTDALALLDEFLDSLASMPSSVDEAKAQWSETARPFREAQQTFANALAGFDGTMVQVVRPWVGALADKFRVELAAVVRKAEVAVLELSAPELRDLERAIERLDAVAYNESVDRARVAVRRQVKRLKEAWNEAFLKKVQDAAADIKRLLAEGNGVIGRALASADEKLKSLKELAQLPAGSLAEFRAKLIRTLPDVARTWESTLQNVDDAAATAAEQACASILPDVTQYKQYLAQLLDPGRLNSLLDQAFGRLPTAEEIARRLRGLEHELSGALRDVLERAGGGLEQLARPVMAAGDRVLRLARAFGEVPRVPGLDFHLPTADLGGLADQFGHIGYYFAELPAKAAKLLPLPHVDITPVLAEANRLGRDVLNALEIKLPTSRLLDRFKPFDLKNFDLRKIFPNFAGLNLANLFDGLKLPELANDNIKVSHGEDPQSLTGWVQIDVDVPFADPITVFSIASLSMSVKNGRFRAMSRMDASAQGARQTFRGDISGNWELVVGGFKLLVIENTVLRFDDSGRIAFEVRPDNVKLPGPMAWLSDLVSRFNYSDQGISVKTGAQGVQVVLDLPLPDIQAGAFGLANLRLGFFFELSVSSGFVVSAGANVARRDAPFTITVFILGGAGWFDFQFRYVPATHELYAKVSIGIMASASLAISLGPISGGIFAYFGIVVDYEGGTGRSGQLSVSLALRFIGRVSVLGIISVHLELALEAQYSTGGGLVGRGYVRLKIKICWCFTISVSCSVSYTFGKSGGATGGVSALPAPAPAYPLWAGLDRGLKDPVVASAREPFDGAPSYANDSFHEGTAPIWADAGAHADEELIPSIVGSSGYEEAAAQYVAMFE
jgi:hypothetical protein